MEKLTDEQIQQSIEAMEGYGFHTDEYIMEHLQASEEHLNDPDFEPQLRKLIVDFTTTGIIEDFQQGWRNEWLLDGTGESIICIDSNGDCSWLYLTQVADEKYHVAGIWEHSNVRNLIDLIDDDTIIDFWLEYMDTFYRHADRL